MIIYDHGSGLYETVVHIDLKKESNIRNYRHEKKDQKRFEFDYDDFKFKEKGEIDVGNSRNYSDTDSK